jgi:hypothetical protein
MVTVAGSPTEFETARAVLLALGLPSSLEVYWVEEDYLEGALVGYAIGYVSEEQAFVAHVARVGRRHQLAGHDRGWPVSAF